MDPHKKHPLRTFTLSALSIVPKAAFWGVVLSLVYFLLSMAIFHFIGGRDVPVLVVWWGFQLFFCVSAFILSVLFFFDTVQPAFQKMRKYRCGFAFALAHHGADEDFIKFKLAQPVGYTPWGWREYRLYLDPPARSSGIETYS